MPVHGDEQPLRVEAAWDSLDLASYLETADPAASLYEQLDRVALALSYRDQTIESAMPTERESAIFGFTTPTPCALSSVEAS